jgi:hypothetical protein
MTRFDRCRPGFAALQLGTRYVLEYDEPLDNWQKRRQPLLWLSCCLLPAVALELAQRRVS